MKLFHNVQTDPIYSDRNEILRAKFIYFKYTQKIHHFTLITFTFIFIKRKEDADFEIEFFHKIQVNF